MANMEANDIYNAKTETDTQQNRYESVNNINVSLIKKRDAIVKLPKGEIASGIVAGFFIASAIVILVMLKIGAIAATATVGVIVASALLAVAAAALLYYSFRNKPKRPHTDKILEGLLSGFSFASTAGLIVMLAIGAVAAPLVGGFIIGAVFFVSVAIVSLYYAAFKVRTVGGDGDSINDDISTTTEDSTNDDEFDNDNDSDNEFDNEKRKKLKSDEDNNNDNNNNKDNISVNTENSQIKSNNIIDDNEIEIENINNNNNNKDKENDNEDDNDIDNQDDNNNNNK